MKTDISHLRRIALLAIGVSTGAFTLNAAQPANPGQGSSSTSGNQNQLTLTGAEPNLAVTELVLSGANLGTTFTGTVTLAAPGGAVVLQVLGFDAAHQELTVRLPSTLINFPGTYLVTVTTGSGGNQTATMPVTFGEVGPVGRVGDVGPIGLTGPQGVKGDTGATGAKGDKGDKGDIGATGAKGDTGVTGATGVQGEVGPQGLKGDKGDKGDTGAQGPQGVKGDTGATGAQGATGVTGPQGPIGLTGPQGPQGIQGITGDTGPIGPQGPQGNQGPQGIAGAGVIAEPEAAGRILEYGGIKVTDGANSIVFVSNGAPGAQGLQGIQGIQGPQGPKGDTGLPGATGPEGQQGVKGDTGATGPQGLKGDKGDTGAIGATGPAGSQGVKGDTGAIGPQGPTGATGAQGPKGDTGAIGATGPQGLQGLKGDTGATGSQGLKGDKGDTGAAGATGATGATGPQGPQGVQGVAGPAGPQGPQGLKGDTGSTGATGATGPQGPQGATGATGPQGAQGAAGVSPFTQNGTSATYTVGNVGIGNSNPQNALSVFGSQAAVAGTGPDATSPGQTVTGTAGMFGSQLASLFDNTVLSYWEAPNGAEFTVDFGAGNAKTIIAYRLQAYGSSAPEFMPAAWTVAASNDGTTFVTLDARSNQAQATSVTYSFANTTPYRYYRFSNFLHRSGFGSLLGEVDLYPPAYGPGTVLEVAHNGRVGILTSSPQYALDVNGEIRGTLVSNSDVRWKRDIAPLAHALETVTKLNGVSYAWRNDEFPERNFPTERSIGVIAQQVEAVVPELVSTDREGNKAVNYPLTVPLLIEAIKELKQQNDALRARVDALAEKR